MERGALQRSLDAQHLEVPGVSPEVATKTTLWALLLEEDSYKVLQMDACND